MLTAISLEGTQRQKFIRYRGIAQINQQNLAALNNSSSKKYLFLPKLRVGLYYNAEYFKKVSFQEKL